MGKVVTAGALIRASRLGRQRFGRMLAHAVKNARAIHGGPSRASITACKSGHHAGENVFDAPFLEADFRAIRSRLSRSSGPALTATNRLFGSAPLAAEKPK